MADADVMTPMENEVDSDAGRERTRLLPDPAQLWIVFRRRLWIFVLAFALVCGLVAFLAMRTTPLYSATASLVIEPRHVEVANVRAVVSDLRPGPDVVDTEVQILSSSALAGRVANTLNLGQYPEYSLRGRVVDPDIDPSLHPLAPRLLSNMRIDRVGGSLVINVTAISREPKLAALIANAYAEEYVKSQIDRKNTVTASVSQKVQGQLQNMRTQVAAADEAVQRYKIRNGLMSAQGSTMAEQEVSALNQQIAASRAEVAEKQGRYAAARQQLTRGGGGSDVGAALASGTVATLRTQEANKIRELAELSSRYGELYPDVQKTKQELTALREQIQLEINRILSSLRADVQAAQSRLNSLTSSQASASGSLAQNNSAAVGLLELQRRAEAAREIYTAFLNRSKETVSQEGLAQADAHVDSLARAPALPFQPNIPLLVVVAIVGGIISGLLAIAGAEYLDGGVRTKTDVERRLRLRYLGAVPTLASTLGKMRSTDAPQDYVVGHPMSSFAESLRSLRANIQGRSRTTPKVIAITSALPREGKSTTSMALARTLALSGLSTVLVDCDIRRRSVSESLLPDDWDGLVALIDGKMSLDEALYKDSATELHILGTTRLPDAARDLLPEPRIDEFLGKLRNRFDVVILDTAPVLGIAETRRLAAAADAVVLLAHWKKTSISAARAATELLINANVPLRGLAITMVDIRKFASVGQGDSYNYHKKFKGYYVN